MNALAHKLHEIAIVLENEVSFVEQYKTCAGESYALVAYLDSKE